MAQLHRAALLMSQDDLHSALSQQADQAPQLQKQTHNDHDPQPSLPADQFALMPYETAEIQESSESFEGAIDQGEEDAVAAVHLWDEPIKSDDS